MLDSRTIIDVTRQVQARFPEMNNSQPRVRLQAMPKSSRPTLRHDTPRYLVTYRGKVCLPAGEQIERWVRVVVNTDGKILKITTSR